VSEAATQIAVPAIPALVIVATAVEKQRQANIRQRANRRRWKKKHYSADPEYRRRSIDTAAQWNKEHRDGISGRRNKRYQTDAEYKAHTIAMHREWVNANREEHTRKTKVWRDNNQGRLKENHWKKLGIDMATWSYAKYLEMLKAQDHKCIGCGKKLVALSQDIVEDSEVACVDHIHDGSGRVRWLLCKGCNTALGGVRDNPATLVRLADMLMQDKSRW